MTHPTIRLALCACCAMLLVAGCRPITPSRASPPTPIVETGEQGDRLNIFVQDKGVRIDVYSERGIGAAQVHFPGQIGEPIVVAFHLQGLEQAVFDNGEQRLEISVSSHDPSTVFQSLTTQQGVRPLTEDDPLWARVEIVAENSALATIPLRQGRIEVTLPSGFLNAQHPVLSLRWIDFYR
ncbi:MAG: hypothetical protein NZ553_10895 [Caldilinea sp.]|nr:hypothetical protein [Caldilinea sp.]MDW8440970.1 hypothetical protein [Caldilineaceae bacterium]